MGVDAGLDVREIPLYGLGRCNRRTDQQADGKRVSLHYEEKAGIPTTCFGDTRYYVTKITPVEEIPLAPGVVVPTQPAPAAVSAPAKQ